MLRTGARSSQLLRPLTSSLSLSQPAIRLAARQPVVGSQLTSAAATRCLSSRRPSPAAPLTVYKPVTLSLQRYASTTPPVNTINKKAEEKIAKEKISPAPEEVSPDSSVRHVLTEQGAEAQSDDIDMLAGLKSDFATIKETFALTNVPREALFIGMAGVLPYLATSISTVYLAWDINHAHVTGQGFLVSGQTAEALLHIIEPLQVGYGAVIISFLGAIHWGLEFAKYGGAARGYPRYAIGVVAPAVAWPTILMPVEYALITQFLTFVFLYFADARATVRGWAPGWYSTYRFVLTFVVGASIVLSLIGRGEIVDKIGRLPGPAERMKALRDAQWENLENEEKERRATIAAQEEAAEDGEEEGEGEGEGEEGGKEEGEEEGGEDEE